VLEIGAGSGLLSIIAASLGAKCVVAIEANRHLADVATEIIKRNGYEGRIHIINRMSTDVTREEVLEYRVGVRVWVRVRVKVRARRCSSTATLTCCHSALLPSYPPPGARVRRP
jgi:tRNA G37 N-methylase Trm5